VATISTVASIFLLLLAGYGAKRFGILKVGDVRPVNTIIIYLTMPAFIFINTHNKPLTSAMVKAPVLGIVMEMVVMCAAYALARGLKLNRTTTGGLMLAAVFGNTGFLGYPMVAAAFPHNNHALLTAVMFDEFAMSMVLCSIGVAVATSFSGKCFSWSSLLEFLKVPLFPATVIALIFRTLYVPPTILKTLNFLAAGTVPLAMISIGLSLSAGSIKKYPKALGACFILKMIALPALMFFTLPLLGVTGTIKQVVVLESAVPPAVFAGVVASRYGGDDEFVAGAIFVMTLLSVITMPIVLMLMK